jgi:SAM-dependent methyltransferase
LARLHTVIVLPAHRRQSPVAVPPSLYPADAKPENLTLPDNAQILKRHPLLLELEARQQEVALELDQVSEKLREAETELENSAREKDQIKQQLVKCDEQLSASNQELEQRARISEQQAEAHRQALAVEQDKTSQLAQERDQYLRQRDEEWNKGETLTKERDELKRQLEQAIKQRDEARHHNHLNHQAKNAAEARVSELEERLVEATRYNQTVLKSGGENLSAGIGGDGFYRALEDKFRGTREDIKQRVRVYLPFVRPIAERNPGVPALDLGCGRGEWLEVLKEANIAGHGIDQDTGMLQGDDALGLSVEQGDAITYLRTQADASRICVSLIHVVEHLPFDMLRDIVAEAKRVLVPDGLLIMETPNPENITVGSCSFYTDPTHRNPLPPPLLAFVPEFYGFERVKVLRLQESPTIHHKEHFDTIDYLSAISPDYAVIAQVSLPSNELANGSEQKSWEREYGISLSSMVQKSSVLQKNDE